MGNRGVSWAFIVIILGLLFGLYMMVGYRPIRPRNQGQFTACKSNLKNLGTGLEMYASDFAGLYPASLSQLTPNYLKMIPQCASAQIVTYEYEFNIVPRSSSTPSGKTPSPMPVDSYTIFCKGNHHEKAGALPNYPQYYSDKGMVDR